jgi:CRISPR/Cas system-associated exonuclease Cas4 (RecB family)
MSDMQRENARLARKRRKEQLEIKRGTKRTRIVDETDKVINARIARMKRKEKLQQLREAKRARQNNSEPSQQTSIQASSSSTPSTIVHSQIWNFGKPTYICQHCNALLWYEERLNSNKSTTNPSFGMCCKQGKIKLPPLKEPPQYLKRLLTGEGKDSTNFRENIRSYNSMFAFTSMGGIVDKEINMGKGPYVFRLHGQNYHHIGTLLPEEGNKPRFAQLYIYDTENEVANRISVSGCSDKTPVDPSIVTDLQNMIDENNILAKSFRMARDRFKEEDYHDVTLRLISDRDKPSTSEVAALVVKDPTEESEGRDIIVEYKDMVPKRISEIHPKFMAMQYLLLFPYGEDGFTLKIPYNKKEGVTYSREYVTMLEYYAYYLQQRPDQFMLLLTSGHLSLQFWVDVFTCIEQNRLNWIRKNQGKLRTDLYSGLHDAIERGDTRTEQVGKRIVLPSSFTGSRRNKAQNFQDAMAICRWAGYPDIFLTFTCNAKWPEIQYMLDEAGRGQKPEDRPDIVNRVYNIKLKELLIDIKERKYFGETKSGKFQQMLIITYM